MIALLQRVSRGQATVAGEVRGKIGPGLVILLGVHKNDTSEDCNFLVEKTSSLRIFSDDTGKMNRSLIETGGSALVISQFTLVGDWRKGRRPSYIHAAAPEQAEDLYNRYSEGLRTAHIPVETGVFGAMMQIELVNDGPVTFVLDSKER